MPSVLVISASGASNAVDVAACGAAGLTVRQERFGENALAAAKDPTTTAVVVDADGRALGLSLAFCRQLRNCSDRWLILLVPRLDEAAETMAWSIGVNDYVSRGAGPKALVARLLARVGSDVAESIDRAYSQAPALRGRRARVDSPRVDSPRFERPGIDPGMRRSTSKFTPCDERLNFANLTLDGPSRLVFVDEQAVHLTRTEFDLLAMLMTQPLRVFSRAELIAAVWGETWFGDDHFVETHTSRLRRKIAAAGGPRIAAAVRGVGYRLVDGLERVPLTLEGLPGPQTRQALHEARTA